eukprot:TRINITY_DN2640_c0_g1_i1.p1 TRINITY_DN2640_c0_g1~~TRINITY_DN2640_c0_g1_i1.p1  ORF type:complete len:227 (+),score=36.98 TRINITY_DN2640_c0_g1_i1:814-1494(+)
MDSVSRCWKCHEGEKSKGVVERLVSVGVRLKALDDERSQKCFLGACYSSAFKVICPQLRCVKKAKLLRESLAKALSYDSRKIRIREKDLRSELLRLYGSQMSKGDYYANLEMILDVVSSKDVTQLCGIESSEPDSKCSPNSSERERFCEIGNANICDVEICDAEIEDYLIVRPEDRETVEMMDRVAKRIMDGQVVERPRKKRRVGVGSIAKTFSKKWLLLMSDPRV